MKSLVFIEDVFDISYGNGLALNQLEKASHLDSESVNFVARTSKNNGVSAIVKKSPSIQPFKAGSISVALSANVLESFVQPSDFYTSYHIAVLNPKKNMSVEEKIYYCLCIKANSYKYSYGRQANRTFRSIRIPRSSPSWMLESSSKKIKADSIRQLKSGSQIQERLEISQPCSWKGFKYKDLFDIKKGKRIVNQNTSKGKTPLVRPLKHSNGYSQFISNPPNHSGNTISVNYNSEGGVGFAFYQPQDFYATDDVHVLYPKFNLTPEIAIFLITLIQKERYRFNYGRKWNLERMQESVIQLPTKDDSNPDWEYIQKYISSLPYSQGIK